MSKKVLITGASGLLGRAIYKEFVNEGSWNVLGLAFSRCTGKLRKVDITKDDEVQAVMKEFAPSVVIHAAAERKPDVVDSQPEATQTLNVSATKTVCQQAAAIGAWVLYISTDYVFDGKSPPYPEDATPSPLNRYGQTKFEGEKVTMEVSQDNSVLRVPILYGKVENLDESAVTVLFKKVQDTSQKCMMSDYERRYPTYCDDIAVVIRQLAEKRLSYQKNLQVKRKEDDDELKFCDRLLEDLMGECHQSYAWPFYQPVDPVAFEIYDYFEIIKRPMDLSTIKNNLECDIYQTSEDFSTDMRLIYSNCYTYSIPDSEVYKMAQKLEEYFEQEFSKLKSTVTRGDIDQREVTNADYSTNVEFQLQNVTLEDTSIKGIYHFSGEEMMTKYNMAVAMADAFGIPPNHIQPDNQPSVGASRPYNSHLSCHRITELGLGKTSPFKETILNILKEHQKT